MVSEICAGDRVLEGLEKDAREAKKGLCLFLKLPLPY
jgi:hypothetical protein